MSSSRLFNSSPSIPCRSNVNKLKQLSPSSFDDDSQPGQKDIVEGALSIRDADKISGLSLLRASRATPTFSSDKEEWKFPADDEEEQLLDFSSDDEPLLKAYSDGEETLPEKNKHPKPHPFAFLAKERATFTFTSEDHPQLFDFDEGLIVDKPFSAKRK